MNKDKNKLLELETSHLEKKINQLLQRYKAVQAHVKVVEQENASLQAALKEQNKQINNLPYQKKISKIVDQLHINGNDVVFSKEKIDQYVKEIDNCISFLNKQI